MLEQNEHFATSATVINQEAGIEEVNYESIVPNEN